MEAATETMAAARMGAWLVVLWRPFRAPEIQEASERGLWTVRGLYAAIDGAQSVGRLSIPPKFAAVEVAR